VLIRGVPKVLPVEVGLLTFAPPKTGLVMEVSYDEIRQNDEWIEGLREAHRKDADRCKKVGLDPDMTGCARVLW